MKTISKNLIFSNQRKLAPLLCFILSSCHVGKLATSSQSESSLKNGPTGVSPKSARQAIQYKFVDKQGKIRGRLVPNLSQKWGSEKLKVEFIRYEALVYDQQNILSRRDFNSKDGNYSIKDSDYAEPLGNQKVSWRVNSGLTIEGTLIPEFNIVDPEPPAVGDEVIIYHGRSCLSGDFQRVYPTVYRVTAHNFSAKLQTQNLPKGDPAVLVEHLNLKVVPKDAKKNQYMSETARDSYRSRDAVYRRDKNGEEKLYGFVVADHVWDDETNQQGLLVESIHSIPVKEAIKGKHDPVCDIRATPAYEEFWKSAFFNFMAYLDKTQDSQTSKTCKYDLDIPGTPPLTTNRIVYTSPAEHLKIIENATKKPGEANQYLCSNKWAKLRTDISSGTHKVTCDTPKPKEEKK